jgi:nitrate/TMAO reductase-like tetraheme cytochrome c subunit
MLVAVMDGVSSAARASGRSDKESHLLMLKRFLAGFIDPVRRPRYVIWCGVAVLVIAVVMVLALGITSSRWFCAEGCHKVQDDTIIAYSHSSHDKISCMACHMPVNGDPLSFMLHKVEALGELYLTVTNQFELPLNKDDALALDKAKMPSAQCTQCHDLARRKVTPPPGIIINHDVHAQNGITCTTCHNRVAHNEDFTLTLPGDVKHQDFMKMQACFRCHTLIAGQKGSLGYTATGKCSACHTVGFELKPASHLDQTFYPKGHAQLAKTNIAYCTMCHEQTTFCNKCHGLQMPHPADFMKGKGADSHSSLLKAGKVKPQQCLICHGNGSKSTTQFCDACHHPDSIPTKPWVSNIPGQSQHAVVVRRTGATPCFECHDPVFCATCHVRGIKR